MRHTINTIEATLKRLAGENKLRSRFNKAVSRIFPFIDGGAFREVYDAGDYVIKLRTAARNRQFSKEQTNESNSDEIDNYRTICEKAEAVGFFVLAPVYLVLDNKHDAIIMPKVSTCCSDPHYMKIEKEEDFCIDLESYAGRFFPKIMRDQLSFIIETFGDSHDGNIGWDMAKRRVWFIDINFEFRNDYREVSNHAKRLLRRVSRSTARKVA